MLSPCREDTETKKTILTQLSKKNQMKTLVLSLLTVAGLGFAASAQTNKPVTFGVKAGIAFPSMTVSSGSASVNFDSKTSFYVGGTVDFAVSDIISIQPGLTFINKGTKLNDNSISFEEEEFGTDEEATLNFKYLELPVNVVANFKLGSGKLFVGAGPYFAYALSANGKIGSVKEDIKFGENESEFKRSDFGLNFLAGYQLNNGFNIHAGYGLGLSSILDQDVSEDITFKNKVFSVGVGFSF
jgi:opacity protein-like surface antigen